MNARTVPTAGLVALATIIAGYSQAQNLVQNADFETPVIASVYEVIPRGSSRITHWSVDAPFDGWGVDLINSRNVQGISKHGFQAIDMAGTPGRGTLYQDLPTVVGEPYALSFWLSSNNGPWTNGLTVKAGGVTLATVSSPSFPTWQRFGYSFVATSSSTRLDLIGNIDGNQGVFLDSVAVIHAVRSLSGYVTLSNVDASNHEVDITLTAPEGSTPL